MSLSLFVLLLASCAPRSAVSDSSDSSAVDSTTDTDSGMNDVPDDASGKVDLANANPFDPSTTYTWRFEYTDDEVNLINAAGSTYYGVDTHIYGYADSLTVTTLDERSSIMFEKPEVSIGGEMNYCVLPCKAQLIVDLNEYHKKQLMGGYDNLKFGNMLYGGPYEEFFENNVYFPSIGINTPMQAYGWMDASYLGYLPLDYEVQEMVKEDFLDRTYGVDGWLMAFEGSGDIGSGSSYFPICQAGDCDDAVLTEIETDAIASRDNGTFINFLDRRYLGGSERFFSYCGGEKMVGQWDGYCDATHNYDWVIVVNPDDSTQPFFDLVPHSLDLTLNPDYDYGWYGIFGGSFLVQACLVSADGCADAYVTHLEAMNESWYANVDLYEAQLDAQNAYLESIDMQYGDYPGWLSSNKNFIEDRYDTITGFIASYYNPCLSVDTGWYRGWDTGGSSGCSDTGGTETTDTGSGSDTGSGGDTAVDTAAPADTGA